ncbi:MAG TPA: hypothetical protein ENK06_09705, partial [Gammaproteobacteria bacterium]|nr:hypothetical protein [Gammaproteobacteria bacterium]
MASESKSALYLEVKSLDTFMWVFVSCALTGIITHLYDGEAWVWQQVAYLLHSVSGLLLGFTLLHYAFLHSKRVIGVRRFVMILGGLFLVLLVILLFVSGIWFLWYGQSTSLVWLFDFHIWLGYVVIFTLLLHLYFHRFKAKRKEEPGKHKIYITLSKRNLTSSSVAVITFSGLIVLFTLTYQNLPSPYIDQAVVEPYETTYGDHPFRPSQTETSSGGFIDVRRIANSDDCGSCHAQILKDWLSSMHRQAAMDPSYVKNINLLEQSKGIAATRYCEGCHAPVALLSGELSKGGKHGGVKGTAANLEGVGCTGCHAIRRAVHLNGVASFEFEVQNNYLFQGFQAGWLKKINHLLIQIHPQEHKKALSQAVVKSPELCATCHEQFMDKTMNQWGWVKMQTEYSRWVESPFSGRSDHAFSTQQTKTCNSCHMPLVSAPDPSANRNGKVLDHRFVGANTLLPALSGDKEQLKRVQRFLQAKKVAVDIDVPSRQDAMRSGQFIDENIRTEREIPYYLYLGEKGKINVVVSNVQVGHQFPGGTTDINQVWIYLKVSDADNRIVYESGGIDKQGKVEAGSHFYQTIAVDKQGKEVWKHDLFRMVGDTYKN